MSSNPNGNNEKGSNNVKEPPVATNNNDEVVPDYKAQVNSRTVNARSVDPPESTPGLNLASKRPNQPKKANLSDLDYKAQVNSRSTVRVATAAADPPDRNRNVSDLDYKAQADSRTAVAIASKPPKDAARISKDPPPNISDLDYKAQVNSRSVIGVATKTPASTRSGTSNDAKSTRKHWVYDDNLADLDYKAQANGYDVPLNGVAIAHIGTNPEKGDLGVPNVAGNHIQSNDGLQKNDAKPRAVKNKNSNGLYVDEESFINNGIEQPQSAIAELESTQSGQIPIVFLQNEPEHTDANNNNNGTHTEPTTTAAVPSSNPSNDSESKVPMRMMVMAVIAILCVAGIVVGGVCGSGSCRSSSEDRSTVPAPASDDTNVTAPTTTTAPTVAPIVFTVPTPAPTMPLDCSSGPIPFTSTQQLYDAVDEYLIFLSLGDLSETAINSTNATLCYGYPMNAWDVSRITDFSRVFDPEHNLEYDRFRDINANPFPVTFTEDLNNWDTSSATTMFGMFAFASGFNGNISLWNLSSVTNTSDMFIAASIFNGDVSNWDVSNVVDMTFMFSEANAFNGDLSRWNTRSVEWMGGMFGSSIAFQGDLSLWDTSSVRSMLAMFAFAPSFNSDLSNWDVSNVLSTRLMFSNAVSFNGNIFYLGRE